jgi:alpha-galactosidase
MLATGGRQPPLSRHQQVLDFAHPAVTAYLSGQLDALLDEYDIGYLKWDHNRDLVDAGHWPGGEAGVHGHTLAVYRFLDELRQRHPALEIESCSSGGARVDFGILQRTDRVWGSDTNDALERQSIQRWTELLVPPELIGAHVGPPRAHTTMRTQALSFRAGTAIFGHFGIEWDITAASDAELDELRRWISCYKELRPLLHAGRVVRSDHPDPALWVHGVVAADSSAAVFAIVAMATGVSAPPGRVRLPGLDPESGYRVEPILPDRPGRQGRSTPPSLSPPGGITVAGRVLSQVGLQAPLQHPEHLLLLHLTRV